MLAIDAGEARPGHALKGDATTDPSFGCPGPVDRRRPTRDHAIAEGFLTVDAGTVIATHLNQLLGERPQDLLGPDEVKALIDALKEHSAGLVETIYSAAAVAGRADPLAACTAGRPHPDRPPAADPLQPLPRGAADRRP